MTYRLTSSLISMLIGAATFLTTVTSFGQADDGKRVSSEEKAGSISAAMESSLEALPKLYETVSKSIVRVEGMDITNTIKSSKSGVIVSPEGHILVGGSASEDLKVYLSDGRIATATAAGWSNEWGLSVRKINEIGPWPAIELGSTKSLKAGTPCLVFGYPPRADAKFDSSPAARFGFIDRNVSAHWFTTSCFPGFDESALVVGVDGRLLGINNWASYHAAIDVFVANRKDLFAGKNLDWVRYPPTRDSVYHLGAGPHPEMLNWRKIEDGFSTSKPPEPMSDEQMSDAKQIATKTTVRLVSKDRLDALGEGPDRWSGVIVSEDGYILTCAHTEHLPGERFTIRFSDGRDVDGVALGTTLTADVGLVKITTAGSWPFAKIVDSSTLNPGDPLVTAGYPAINNITRKHWSTERMPQIDTTTVKLPAYLLWNGGFRTTGRTDWPYQGGMSGGGVFNRDGCYVGIFQGNDSPNCTELAQAQLNELKHIQSIDTAIGLPHPLRKRFVAPSMSAAQSVVELLVDSEPISIGTVVDTEGWILTKASALSGKVSCRLPDQSVVVAEKRAESQEHDLALLKIDVAGLTAAEFSEKEPPSITQAMCAVGPRQVLKPGIVSIETRPVPAESSWKGEGTEDKPEGPMISESIISVNNKQNLSTSGTKLQFEDIITSINGHPTPNVATLVQILRTNLADYCTGDLASVELLREGASFKVNTSLPRAAVENYWMMDEYGSPRQSGFDSVFDTDIELLLSEVGSPVIDLDGRIRGIAIASRGRNETQRGPTCVLPSDIVGRVTKQLMVEAKSK